MKKSMLVSMRMNLGKSASLALLASLACPLLVSGSSYADDSEKAYKVGAKVVTIGEVTKNNQSEFYDLEKRKYDLVEETANQAYLEYYWQTKAAAEKKSVEEVKNQYFAKNVKVADSEVKATLNQYKSHPQLSKLPPEQQNEQIRQYLEETAKRKIIENIIAQGRSKGEFAVLYPAPQEPVYEVAVIKEDVVRYRADGEYAKPKGCEGEACAVTVIEYSEFQCPFCERVIPDINKVMKAYEGKIRWIVRDFPLSFHDRARPAAIAAKCAAQQNKYWEMYKTLFENQKSLDDKSLESYAQKSGADMTKWKACVAKPVEAERLIDTHFASGSKLGVNGTPAFFINGRKISGALPFSEFKRIIDDELAKGGKGKGKKSA